MLASTAAVMIARSDDDRITLKSVKFAMETGLLLYATSGCAGLPDSTRKIAKSIAAELAPVARSDEIVRRALYTPSLAAELAAAHACLAQVGLPDDSFQRRISVLVAADGTRSYERLPWKELELSWIHRMLGAAPVANVAAAIPLTLFARGLDVLSGTREELCCFTHAVIYLSDLGRSVPQLPGAAPDIIAEADAALARCMADLDFDLAAELLLTWPYLRANWSPIARAALNDMISMVEASGILPSATFVPYEWAKLPPAGRKRYFLRESYHTAYVWGFLMLATLQPWAAPETEDPAGRDTFELNKALWTLVSRHDMPALARFLDDHPDLDGVLATQAGNLIIRHAQWHLDGAVTPQT